MVTPGLRIARRSHATVKARARRMLNSGMHAAVEDLARAKGVSATYVSGILQLTLLAPEIVEAILDGRQPEGMRLEDLLEGFPADWEGQLKSLATITSQFARSEETGPTFPRAAEA